MNEFWLCFVPLFVAVDAIGVLPMFLALTDGLPQKRRENITFQSILTASVVTLVFLVFGPALLAYLGLALSDFMIAGGILLLAISLSDLLSGEKKQRITDSHSLGAVPIGVPLIAGPAVLTTSLLLAEMYGKMITSMAVIVNIGIAGVVFWFAQPITRILGKNGTKTVSKVASLLLSAIAVMLIRRGIIELINIL